MPELADLLHTFIPFLYPFAPSTAPNRHGNRESLVIGTEERSHSAKQTISSKHRHSVSDKLLTFLTCCLVQQSGSKELHYINFPSWRKKCMLCGLSIYKISFQEPLKFLYDKQNIVTSFYAFMSKLNLQVLLSCYFYDITADAVWA